MNIERLYKMRITVFQVINEILSITLNSLKNRRMQIDMLRKNLFPHYPKLLKVEKIIVPALKKCPIVHRACSTLSVNFKYNFGSFTLSQVQTFRYYICQILTSRYLR